MMHGPISIKPTVLFFICVTLLTIFLHKCNERQQNILGYVYWTELICTDYNLDKNQGAIVNFPNTCTTGRCFEVSEMPDVYKHDMGGHRNMWRPEQLLWYTLRVSLQMSTLFYTQRTML